MCPWLSWLILRFMITWWPARWRREGGLQLQDSRAPAPHCSTRGWGPIKQHQGMGGSDRPHSPFTCQLMCYCLIHSPERERCAHIINTDKAIWVYFYYSFGCFSMVILRIVNNGITHVGKVEDHTGLPWHTKRYGPGHAKGRWWTNTTICWTGRVFSDNAIATKRSVLMYLTQVTAKYSFLCFI